MKNNQPINYKMTKKMFNAILATRGTEEEKKQSPHEYVMSVINEQFGLRGEVTHICIYNQ